MEADFFTAVIWQGLIGAFLASVGFGVLFNVRGKELFFAGITGGVGGIVYEGCLYANLGDPTSNFLAAVALSILGEIFARLFRTTVTTFTACALIPLVPGGSAYEMMVAFSKEDIITGMHKLMDVITISSMLAIGILFVSTMTRFFFYSRDKISSGRDRIYLRNPFDARRSKRAVRHRISYLSRRSKKRSEKRSD